MKVGAMIRAFAAAGCSLEQIADAFDKLDAERKAQGRESNRRRQAEFRARRNENNDSNANNGVTPVTPVTESAPSRACSNTNLPTGDISNIPPLPPKGGEKRKAEPRNRGQRLPEGWTPDAELLNFARSLGFSTDQELRSRAEFADFWRGIPGSRGCKLDWPATYRNRLREVAGRLKLKPAANVLPFSTAPPKEELSYEEMRRRALDFDRRWEAGEFR